MSFEYFITGSLYGFGGLLVFLSFSILRCLEKVRDEIPSQLSKEVETGSNGTGDDDQDHVSLSD